MPEPKRFSLQHRLLREWRMKVWLGALLAIYFCVGYFGIQQLNPLRPPLRLPLIGPDRWIGFSPGWVWVYQSVYLMLPAAWLAQTREQLWRYAAGFILVTSIAFACFLVWPVTGPRPDDASLSGGGLYSLLVRYDRPTNCLPSLHVALAVYSVLFAVRILRIASVQVMSLLAIWTLLIACSTLATRQHYFLDLPPGVLLGWIGHRAAWHYGPLQWPRPQRALAEEVL